MGNAGRRVRLLAFDGGNAELAGGFPSDPILSTVYSTLCHSELSNGQQSYLARDHKNYTLLKKGNLRKKM